MLNVKSLKKLLTRNPILPSFPKVAGTAKEFRDWEIYLKETYPTRYKINAAIEYVYRRTLLFPSWRLRDLKWGIIHRFHPKHQYHVIKPRSLKPGYHDTDGRILYAMGDTFAEFYERCNSNPHHVWDYSDREADEHITQEEIDYRQALWEDMTAIYKWWMWRPTREETLPEFPDFPEEWGMMALFNDDFQDTDEVKEWRRVSEIHREKEKAWEAQDDRMLHKLIDIRRNLWD